MNVIQFPPMDLAREFSARVIALKSADPFNWYPHNIMASFEQTAELIPTAVMDDLMGGGKRIIDVGPADGDLGYFYASRGSQVTFVDYSPTNFNGCKGIDRLGKALGVESNLINADVDFGVEIDGQYDFALCLGLLYHLRNPMLLLMNLAQHAERMIISNRIMTHLPEGKDVTGLPLYFVLECRESNNDPTNYYVMTAKAMRLTLQRSGWIIKRSKLIGSESAMPFGNGEDARLFAYCERVANWADLRKHHDF